MRTLGARHLACLGIAAAVLSAGLATVLVAYGRGEFADRYELYATFSSSSQGVFTDGGTDVKLRGVRVGRVTELELVTEGRPGVRVEIQVDRDTAVHADARAYFELAGVSGLKLINIRDGTPKAPRLPPGSEIPAGETTLDKLSTQGEQLLARASKVLDSTDRLLTGLNRTA